MDSFGGRLAFSSDGGENWIGRYPADRYFFHALHFFDLTNGIAAGSASSFPGFPQVGAIFKTSTGGASWDVLYTGVVSNSLYFLDDLTGWCGGWSDSTILFKTTDGGQNWTTLPGNLEGEVIKIEFFNNSTGYISVSWSGTYEKLYFTDDGGNSWDLKVNQINDFWFTDINKGWYILDDKIFHTNDGGANWQLQYSDSGNNLFSLYFYDSNFGWAAGYDGLILHTNNGGTPVELVSFNVSVEDMNVKLSWITATELNNKGFEIERSKNSEFKKIGFVKGKGTTTEQQVYSFIDENLSLGKYKYRLKQIDFDGSFEYSDIIEVEVGIPNEFSLSQNFPNPFNPSTTIKYDLPQSSFIKLSVYNLLGEEIEVLEEGYKPAGSYETVFDASQLPSGVYVYRLVTENYSSSKKMILIK